MNKSLYKNSFIFVLGDVLNKAIPFLMLPVLTRYLTPEGYGYVALFGVMVSILVVFAGLSVNGAININYFKLDKEALKVYISNVFIILFISSLVIFISLFLFSPYIIERITLEKEWLFVALLLAVSKFITFVNLGLWMIEEKPKVYSLYQISQTVMITALSLIFVIGLKMGWKGELLALSLGTVFFAMVSLYVIYQRGYLGWNFNREYLKDALKFGVPLVPHALASWVKTGVDRVVIMALLGSAVVGIYSVAYQIGMVILVLVTAFNKAWIPYLFKTLHHTPTLKEKVKIVKFTYVYFALVVILAILFTYSMQWILPYFLGEKFLESSQYILYFALAFAFQGMYFMVGNYIFFVNKTHLLAYVTFGTAAVHIVLLYALLERYGVMGVAYTSCISSFLTFILVWYLSAKVYPMPWNLFRSDIE